MPILKIKVKHLLRSTGYFSNTSCAMALAANDHFGTKTAVGGTKIREYEERDISSFDIDHPLDIAITEFNYYISMYDRDKIVAESERDHPENVIRVMKYVDLNVPINA